jgi:hypothetical protein
MKAYRILVTLIILFSVVAPAMAAQRSENWDNLIEFSYKFTWYPRQDLQDLLKAKSNEYQQSLEEYRNLLIAELTDGASVGRTIEADVFEKTKPWKLYYRLAIAEFCSFLVRDDDAHLANAIAVLSVIAGRREMSNVSFWHFLFQSYSSLRKKDRDGFVNNVFLLWNDPVMKAEINQMIIQSNTFKTEGIADIYYFYENTAHLIITKAIIENQMPDLHPLSAIVVSLNEKLALENGYKRFVEAIAERLDGLKSDNNNLNFAVAFVEATANQYEFEDETSGQLIVAKYTDARLSYELALSWASTDKGKAALLTQYMGFKNYIVRRLVEKDKLLTSHSIFLDVPTQAGRLADASIGLYHQLADSAGHENKFAQDGFFKKSNYLEAMHQLWDSIAKLLMTLTSYHELTPQTTRVTGETTVAEAFLLKYLSLFQRYSQTDTEIMPDNAVYMAAYAATQLTALYTEAMRYSTDMHYNNLAFAYQLQAVELFPLDILGILKLSYQTDQENRPRIYFQYVAPLAARLRNITVTRSWLEKKSGAYKNATLISLNVVPDIVENAFIYLDVLQQTQGTQSEEYLYNKLLVMNAIYVALKMQYLDKQIPEALSAVARRNFSGSDVSLSIVFNEALPAELRNTVQPPPELKTKFSISRLKNELYASPDMKIHSFLRELYFENNPKSYEQLLQAK